MKQITYFTSQPGDPSPLTKQFLRVVRFNEIDPMGIMWHGHYPSYLEDARMALGNALGLGYQDFYDHGILIPVRKMHIDYLAPLKFAQPYQIEARLFYTEAARLNYDFTIYDENHRIMTRAYSIQLMVDKNENLLFEWPEFTQNFLKNWKSGKINLQ